MGTIETLRAMPLWERRKWHRRWESKIASHIYTYFDFSTSNALSMTKVRDLLVESKLYLAAPSDFNDPYDFAAYITLDPDPIVRRRHFTTVAKRVVSNNPGVLPHISSRARKVEELVRRAVDRSIANPAEMTDTFERGRDRNGVSCFSEDGRNLLMWSHYASGHTGISLQFNPVNDPGVLMLVHRVDYQEKPAHLKWPQDRLRIVDDVILRKGRIWKREKEVRYVSATTSRTSIDFDGRAVTGVILGARFRDSDQPELKKMLDDRTRRGLPAPKIYRAERRSDQYGVFLRRLKDF